MSQRPDPADCIFFGIIGLICLLFICAGSYALGYSYGKTVGTEIMQKEAMYYKYGEYSKNHSFIWKDEADKARFIEDLDFFKRNRNIFPEIPMVPNGKIDPTQPF